MKYLIFTLLILINCSTLSAQDTLYVRGERKPLLVNIKVVKKKSLNYTKEKGGLIYTVKMEDVKEIKFQKTAGTDTRRGVVEYSEPSTSYPAFNEFDEFRSTISINSIGLSRFYGGLNYLHHLSNVQIERERNHYFVNLGGGYYNRGISSLLNGRDFVNTAKGFYLEFGVRLEISSRINPKNRFHIGLDLNNRWVEKVERSLFDIFNPNPQFGFEVSNVTEFAVQIPIGYTFRSSDGFYFTTGLEVTTEKLFPAAHVGLGVAFGK